jgi:transcriptional regulator with XRE-family HTH domain
MMQLDGFKVHDLRKALGLRLRYIADMTGISIQTLSRSEKTGYFAKYQSLVVSYALDEYLRLNLGIDLESAVVMPYEELANKYQRHIKETKVKTKIEDLENQIKNLKIQLKELES